jgi:predicted ATPase
MMGIVFTGGPGSGKTVVTNILAQANPKRFVVVPEAATQVYEAARTRWDLVDAAERRDLQRRIYVLQREQEDRAARQHPDKILLLDRGTVDGAAYWPDGPEAYWAEIGTTLEAEVARYDHVILLQTAAAIGIYDGMDSNSCRFEDRAGAIRSGELLAQLWAGHKNLQKVAAFSRLNDKIFAIQKLLDAIPG